MYKLFQLTPSRKVPGGRAVCSARGRLYFCQFYIFTHFPLDWLAYFDEHVGVKKTKMMMMLMMLLLLLLWLLLMRAMVVLILIDDVVNQVEQIFCWMLRIEPTWAIACRLLHLESS